jgi:hypothetical protein
MLDILNKQRRSALGFSAIVAHALTGEEYYDAVFSANIVRHAACEVWVSVKSLNG